MRSKYEITHVTKDRAFIIDLNDPDSKSVTNDAENVWDDIQAFYPGTRLIYRDSMGRWDEIFYSDGSIAFKPYTEHLPIEARGW